MWLGLLFSILSIAINFREFDAEMIRSSPPLDYVSLSASYRDKTVQCLVLGQYTRCGPYVIETLLHHFAAEFMRRRDVNNEAWLILSTTVHLASTLVWSLLYRDGVETRSPSSGTRKLIRSRLVRMGYHRDPDHFKSISPFGMIPTTPVFTPGLMRIEGESRRRLWAMLYHLGSVFNIAMPHNTPWLDGSVIVSLTML